MTRDVVAESEHLFLTSDGGERTVDVHVRRLRKALNAGNLGDPLRTVRSAGYSLDCEP